MSISTTINTVEFTGDGSDNSPYSFPYPLQADADIEIRGRTVLDGVEVNGGVPLDLTDDYTVVRSVNNATAIITIVQTTESDAVIADGVTMVIKRVQTQKQSSTYTDDGGAPGDRFEQDLDDLTLQIQSMQDQVDRSLKVDLTEPKANIGNLSVGILLGNAARPVVVNQAETGFGIGDQIEGQVIGPDSATDNAVARFNGTTGEIIQNSGVIVDDSDNMTGVLTLNIGTSTTIAGMLDEDNLVSDSATNVATQQSIKAYVDSVAAAGDHGSLAGLADDDHLQYSLVTGTRSYTGTVTIGTGNLLITSGGITADDNGNSLFALGVTAISSLSTDTMVLSHKDFHSITDRAFAQSAVGVASVNSPTGVAISFLNNDVAIGGWSSTLFTSNTDAQFDLDVDIDGALEVVGNATITTGDLLITAGGITANADADDAFTFGRCLIDARVTDVMFLSHVDMTTAGQRAISQSAIGATVLNSASGTSVQFAVAGSGVGGFTSTLFTSSIAAQFDLDVDVTGDITAAGSVETTTGFFNIGSGSEALILDTNGLTTAAPTRTRITIDTFASAASDTCTDILPAVDGTILEVSQFNSSRDILFQDGTGNLRLNGDCQFTTTDNKLILRSNGTNWFEWSRALG